MNVLKLASNAPQGEWCTVESKKMYRRLTKEELESYKQEAREDEQRVMSRPRTVLEKPGYLNKYGRMEPDERTASRTLRRKKSQTCMALLKRGTCTLGEDCPYSHNDRAAQRGPALCQRFVKDCCAKGRYCPLSHDTEREDYRERVFQKRGLKPKSAAKPKQEPLVKDVLACSVSQPTWKGKPSKGVQASFDTGAAMTVLPRSFGEDHPTTKQNNTTFRTASAELISDEGGRTVPGIDEWEMGES